MVSVITPSYNSANFLKETIRAILAQTFRDLELIVVDDCSEDTSLEIARQAAAADTRLRVHALNANAGAAACRNKGIELARGRYIAFCDSDDLWKPDKLTRQLSFMRERGAAISHTGYEILSAIQVESSAENRVVLPPERIDYRRMLRANFMQCSTVVYDAGRIGKQYFPDLRKRQDYALWLKILRNVDYAHGLRENLVTYRKREDSLSRPLYRNLYYNWLVFRRAEAMSVPRSALCVASNVVVKLVGKR